MMSPSGKTTRSRSAGHAPEASEQRPLRSAEPFVLLRRRIWAQPQRDVDRLHRLSYHPHKLGVQRVQVRLIPELGGEGLEGLGSVVLTRSEEHTSELQSR